MSDNLPTEAEKKMMAEVGLTEQPLPVSNGNPSSHDIAIEEMERRKAYGLRKYNSLLQAQNGRDSVQDAVDETADLFVYLLTERTEREILSASYDKLMADFSQENLALLVGAVSRYLGKK